MKIWPKIDGMLKELAYEIIPRVGIETKEGKVIYNKKRGDELINYIKRFNIYYDRRDSDTNKSKETN